MKIYIETNEKLFKYILSSKIEESYVIKFFSNNVDKNILLYSKDNAWCIGSSIEYDVYKDDKEIDESPISVNDSYTIKFSDENCTLYYLNNYDSNYIDLALNQELITFGSTNEDIIIPNIEGQIQIKKENNSYILIDENNYSFLNFNKTKNSQLKIGDIIFIKGTKIIFLGNYIRLTNIMPKQYKLPLYNKRLIDNTNFSQMSDSEKNINLYNEDDLFFHTPQLKFNIKQTDITIDSPPDEIKDEDLPAIFTIGTSAMIGLSSVITGLSVITSLVNKTATIMEALPSIIICFGMVIGSIVLPILANRYQKRKIKKKENLRKEKYLKYLEEKKLDIQNAIHEQEKILNENFLDLNSIISNIKNDSKKIWNKEITDTDFLTVRLGIGNKKANIVVNAPNKQFTLDDDALKESAIELANSPLLMKDVPITASLVNNSVFPIILECTNKKEFIDGILLQLIANHSPNDLKLVFFLNDETAKELTYVKYLPHTLSSDKSMRFFATNEEEMKLISTFLENEYNERKNKRSVQDKDENGISYEDNEYYKSTSPYYLIITDNFKMAKDSSIVNKVLNTASNYGYSLLMFESNMKNLPSKCERFAKITDTNSGLFGKDLSSKDQETYKAEYLENENINEVISIISNIPISGLNSENSLPQSLEFLEMYNVGKIEQLNILNKWETNNPTNSLASPVGIYKTGTSFVLDLHEKFHGPHGLIAGMTGSGKSEFIITYILSMAVNYHPDEVQFVLIDYKGGGLAGAFENKEANLILPHVIGTITNLDVSEMNRTLVSIKSELKRRQKIFNEVREKVGESTIDIYKYQRLHREGIIKEPISHLFIISDEFAELKDQQPEFMDELISTARIGRSLGVHLILATQKPSGVVNDQIWSNTRFRVCLKVQSSGDSMEMLKRPEAANIKETGRFYLQVGYDELFELGQAAWAGAKYQPSEKFIKKTNDSIDFINNIGFIQKTINDTVKKDTTTNYGDQLSNIVKYIYNLAIKENIEFHKLWLPKIPDEIFISDLVTKYNYTKNSDVIGIIGEYDAPANQYQNLFTINFNKTGNTAIIGIPGSGKENLLTTLIYSLSIYYSPNELNLYVLEFGSESLRAFAGYPQIGDVVTLQEKDKAYSLLKYLDKEMNKRKQLCTEYNGSFNDYNRLSGKKLPLIMTIINNFEAVLENFDDDFYGYLTYLFREASKYGIIFTLTASSTNTVRSNVLQYFANLLSLQLADPFDYKYYMEAPDGLVPAKINGRGLCKIDEKVYEFQTAYIYEKDNINEKIKTTKNILFNEFQDIKARKIPQIPNKITSTAMIPYIKSIDKLPIGIDNEELAIYYHDFTKNKINQIIGNRALSSMNFLVGIVDEITKIKGNHVEIFDTTYSVSLEEEEGNCYSSDNDGSLDKILENIKNNQENNFIFIFGIKEFIDGLSEEYKPKFEELINYVVKTNNNYLFIVDNYTSFKKITLENWYINNVDSSQGIWIGNGINVQVIININNLKIEDANQEFDNMVYTIVDGEYKLIKGIGE